MPDLSIALSSAELEEALLRVVDAEGKVPAALEALGPVIGRDVVVLDAGHGFRVRQLEQIGARVAAFQFPLSDAAAGSSPGGSGALMPSSFRGRRWPRRARGSSRKRARCCAPAAGCW